MSDQAKYKDRIPFETLDAKDSVSSWSLPSMGSNKPVVRSKSRDNKNKPKANEKIETVARPKKVKPLTADELERITEEARKEGFQQGLKEGTEQGIREGNKVGEKTGEQRAYGEARKEIESLQNRLRSIATALFDPMQNKNNELENTVVDIALNLTQSLLRAEISTNPYLLVDIVKQCLSVLPTNFENVRVYLNQNDVELLEKLKSPQAEKWQLNVDENLTTGGCRVETDQSEVDYSVEERLAGYLEKVASIKDTSSSTLPDVPDYAGAREESDTPESPTSELQTPEAPSTDD